MISNTTAGQHNDPASNLFDLRKKLFVDGLQIGRAYAEFIGGALPAHQTRWNDYYSRLTLSKNDALMLNSWTRQMNVIVLAGTWCGDCARTCPMIALIGESCPKINLVFVDNQSNPQIADEFRIHGASRVPVIVTFSEDYLEISRFGDRTLGAYRHKALAELGDACDSGITPPTSHELASELHEWLEHFERAQLLLRLSPMLRRRHSD